VNPIVFGHGVRLFGGSTRKVEVALLGATSSANGVSLLRYDVKRGSAAKGVARGDRVPLDSAAARSSGPPWRYCRAGAERSASTGLIWLPGSHVWPVEKNFCPG
jgi:hypothetical protein